MAAYMTAGDAMGAALYEVSGRCLMNAGGREKDIADLMSGSWTPLVGKLDPGKSRQPCKCDRF